MKTNRKKQENQLDSALSEQLSKVGSFSLPEGYDRRFKQKCQHLKPDKITELSRRRLILLSWLGSPWNRISIPLLALPVMFLFKRILSHPDALTFGAVNWNLPVTSALIILGLCALTIIRLPRKIFKGE